MNTSSFSKRLVRGLGLWATAALLALSGCGDHDDTAVAEGSATVGAAGGTVLGPDGVQLVVPPGALAADTTIRIARTAAGAPALPEDLRPDVAVYEVTPHELQFAVPAQLRLPLDADPSADTTVIAASRGGEWSSVTARFDGRVAVIDRLSLSWFNASAWAATGACAIPPGSTDPYPCVPTTMAPGTTLSSTPGALSADGNTVTGATTLTVPVTFTAKRDCGNGRLVVTRTAWGPGRPTAPAVTVYDQPLPLSPYSTNRVIGSASVTVPVSAADNGYIGLQFGFSCTRSYRNQRGSAGGVLTLSVAVPVQAEPPKIIEAPAQLGVPAGTIASFTVRASAPQGLSVTWQRSNDGGATWFDLGAGTALADGSRYDLTAATADQGAQFRARVCNGTGATQTCLDSSAATLSITPVVPTPSSVTATRIAGQPGTTGSADGPADSARFNTPNYLTLARDGRIAIGDFGNSTIRRVAVDGSVGTLAGSAGVFGYADGTGTAALFRGNGGLAYDSAGNLFVSDWDNHVVRRITPDGVVSTFAGTAGAPGSADGSGAAARFRNPNGLAIDGADNVYVVDWGNHTLRKITPAGEVSTFAGAAGQVGSTDGTGAAARFRTPGAVAIDGAGTLYVTDMFNHTVRRITPAGEVSTLAGQPALSGTADGTGNAARFDTPAWITATASGTLFVVSAAGDTVRRVSPAGVVDTVVGVLGDSAVLRLGSDPRLRNARGVWAVGEKELLLNADQSVLRVRLP